MGAAWKVDPIDFPRGAHRRPGLWRPRVRSYTARVGATSARDSA